MRVRAAQVQSRARRTTARAALVAVVASVVVAVPAHARTPLATAVAPVADAATSAPTYGPGRLRNATPMTRGCVDTRTRRQVGGRPDAWGLLGHDTALLVAEGARRVRRRGGDLRTLARVLGDARVRGGRGLQVVNPATGVVSTPLVVRRARRGDLLASRVLARPGRVPGDPPRWSSRRDRTRAATSTSTPPRGTPAVTPTELCCRTVGPAYQMLGHVADCVDVGCPERRP